LFERLDISREKQERAQWREIWSLPPHKTLDM
jgi:hypothetical protein